MLSKDIITKVKELKQSGKKVYTNCYLAFSREPDKEWYTLDSDSSLAVILDEGGANRLYFYTSDFSDLKKLLDDNGMDPVVEIVAKNREELEDEMQQMGYKAIAHLMRVSNKDISEVISETPAFISNYYGDAGVYATPDDAKEISGLLWNTFDTRISHLLSEEETVEHINNKEFIYCRDESGKIVSLLQLIVSNRSYYVNQVINSGDKNMFHSMVVNTMKQYCDNGGKYTFAWVEEQNHASLGFFEKYGMHFDGLWNVVYVKNVTC